MVIEFVRCRPKRTFFNDILASQLDADRFDYLLRDNLMTGSQYGGFDLGWLLQAITLDSAGERLAVTAKGISAVEDYLQSRYHMYRNVYFHKVVRSAEGMVKLALQRARRLAVQERLQWPSRGHYVHKALLGQQLSVDEFVELDDVSILHCFKTWASGDDAVLAGLCRGLLFRRLYKVVDLSTMTDARQPRDAVAAAEEALARAGGDPSYDLFFDEPANTPYTAIGDESGEFCPEGGIVVVDAEGRSKDFAQTSALVGALNRQLMFRRIHVAEAWRDIVRDSIEPLV
jgi:HD superfamily phosphohydrolase